MICTLYFHPKVLFSVTFFFSVEVTALECPKLLLLSGVQVNATIQYLGAQVINVDSSKTSKVFLALGKSFLSFLYQVSFSCTPGFILQGSLTSSCRDDGWTFCFVLRISECEMILISGGFYFMFLCIEFEKIMISGS